MSKETPQENTTPICNLPPALDESLKGAKLQFGDKLVDPNDRRVRYPHSRVVEQAKDITSSGLLHTSGHRPRSETP